jgi:hypothetical protein
MADNSQLLSTMDREKPTVKEGLATRLLFNDRVPPIVTFVSAVIAFSLSLVALLSGAERGQLQEYEVVIVCCIHFHVPVKRPPTAFAIVKHLNHPSKRNKGGKCCICHSPSSPTSRV